MLVEVVFDWDDPSPEVSLKRPHHGGRGGVHPEDWGRKMLEVSIEFIHSAPIPGLSVLGDKLGSVTVTGGVRESSRSTVGLEFGPLFWVMGLGQYTVNRKWKFIR